MNAWKEYDVTYECRATVRERVKARSTAEAESKASSRIGADVSDHPGRFVLINVLADIEEAS